VVADCARSESRPIASMTVTGRPFRLACIAFKIRIECFLRALRDQRVFGNGLVYRRVGRQGMRVFASLMRTLVILLLTLRVLASPLAMRPESSKTPTSFHLVARVCSWPAQRPQRSISATSLVPCYRGKGQDNAGDQGHKSGLGNLLWLTGADFSRLVGLIAQDSSLGQLPVHLRC
jgi:hypothetical protein